MTALSVPFGNHPDLARCGFLIREGSFGGLAARLAADFGNHDAIRVEFEEQAKKPSSYQVDESEGNQSPDPVRALLLLEAHVRRGGDRDTFKVYLSGMKRWVKASLLWLFPPSTLAALFGEQQADADPRQVYRALRNRVRHAFRRGYRKAQGAFYSFVSLSLFLTSNKHEGSFCSSPLFLTIGQIDSASKRAAREHLKLLREEFEDELASVSDQEGPDQTSAGRRKAEALKVINDTSDDENLPILPRLRSFFDKMGKKSPTDNRSAALKVASDAIRKPFDDFDDRVNPTRKDRIKLRQDMRKKLREDDKE